MQTMYPPIPTPAPDADGAAVLRHVIETDCTFGCTELQLRQAEHAATIAGRRRADEHPAVIERIRRAQDLIAAALRFEMRTQAPQPAPQPSHEAPPPPPPPGGHRSPLTPPPPTRPPAPAVVNPF